MTRRLIIDGNAVYEIDEACMLRRRLDEDKDKTKREQLDQKEEDAETQQQ